MKTDAQSASAAVPWKTQGPSVYDLAKALVKVRLRSIPL